MIYKTIYNVNSKEFDKEVNEMLAKGWELHGFPFAPVTTFEEQYIGSGYAQAFTGADHLEESAEQELFELETDFDDIPF
jgi:hypothetical protein